ncbi:FadR/GntR family transcriptional regulator [Azospirillum thermophilum]|uniref:FadR family transcriptional regulator n=1 Tax=Azospirillum thermophilum TaxID=2202148 RepID=A0A2S2CQ64_9PROT|nr:FCD domain-containing protein [Azospirillum thermophilum]AWK86616.1 FadR family transcriptional regulator [Azospirillum thermophilum]
MPDTDDSLSPQPSAQRISEWVAQQLLDRIARGELVPGERLPGERQLAEQLRVSRVSVRAALQKLKTQGFLTAVQGGGTRVVSSAGVMDGALTAMVRSKHDNLCDLVEIRMALESWAARRAALRATEEQIAGLGHILAGMGETKGDGGRVASDMDFHVAVAQAAGSPVYLHLLSTIRDILSDMVEMHHTEPFMEGHEALMIEHHRAIYEAIARRDADAAAQAVTAHLGWVLARYRAMGISEQTAARPPSPPAA